MCLHASRSGVPRAPDNSGGTSADAREDASDCQRPRAPERLATEIVPRTGKLLREVPAQPVEYTRAAVRTPAETSRVELGKGTRGSVQQR